MHSFSRCFLFWNEADSIQQKLGQSFDDVLFNPNQNPVTPEFFESVCKRKGLLVDWKMFLK